MIAEKKCIFIVGGGFGGIFAALRTRQLLPSAEIHILDESDELGGLLRSDLGPGGHLYDRGTHILSETGDPVVDDLLFANLDHKVWRRFGGVDRDRCGLLLQSGVQESTPFLSASLGAQHWPDVLEPNQNNDLGNPLLAYLERRFGFDEVQNVFRPALENLYGTNLAALDAFVARQLPLERLVTDSFEIWNARRADPLYRSRAACPDQYHLPCELQSPLSSLYPRRMGIRRIVEDLASKISFAGIKVWLGSELLSLDLAQRRISSVRWRDKDGIQHELNDADVIWAAPAAAAAKFFGIQVTRPPSAAGIRKPVLADCTVKSERLLKGFYYYDYGRGDGFRLTNYAAFCDEAAASAQLPLTYELWWTGQEMTEGQVRAFVVKRFTELGLVQSDADITHFGIRSSVGGVPVASLPFMAYLRETGTRLMEVAPSNFAAIGIFASPGLFFMTDILCHARRVIDERYS